RRNTHLTRAERVPVYAVVRIVRDCTRVLRVPVKNTGDTSAMSTVTAPTIVNSQPLRCVTANQLFRLSGAAPTRITTPNASETAPSRAISGRNPPGTTEA